MNRFVTIFLVTLLICSCRKEDDFDERLRLADEELARREAKEKAEEEARLQAMYAKQESLDKVSERLLRALQTENVDAVKAEWAPIDMVNATTPEEKQRDFDKFNGLIESRYPLFLRSLKEHKVNIDKLNYLDNWYRPHCRDESGIISLHMLFKHGDDIVLFVVNVGYYNDMFYVEHRFPNCWLLFRAGQAQWIGLPSELDKLGQRYAKALRNGNLEAYLDCWEEDDRPDFPGNSIREGLAPLRQKIRDNKEDLSKLTHVASGYYCKENLNKVEELHMDFDFGSASQYSIHFSYAEKQAGTWYFTYFHPDSKAFHYDNKEILTLLKRHASSEGKSSSNP